MKNTIFLPFVLLVATCISACQKTTSTVEQKRLELEAKRQELKEKQEIAALNEEMKNVEAELKKAENDKKTIAIKALNPNGRIRGENVILRADSSTESAKMDNFQNGENVTILDKRYVQGDNGGFWYQVRRSNQQTGWVFGKFVEEI